MRFYLLPQTRPGTEPTVGDAVLLPPDESRHLVKVMRARSGDDVGLTDGRGGRYTAVLEDPTARGARLRVVARETDRGELAEPRLWLACGVTKGRNFEWALEKAVELGVHVVQPLLTVHAEVAPRDGKLERWRTIMRGAVKQSGRAWLPRLEAPVDIATWLGGWRGRDVLYGVARSRGRDWDDADLLSPAGLLHDARERRTVFAGEGDLAWVVGPEGGWDDGEVTRLAAAGRPVRLGPHRLRTETAVCAGLTLLASAREMMVGLDVGPDSGA